MPRRADICGIYEIETPRGSRYVGSSQRIHARWAEHRHHLRRGTHHNSRLAAAHTKYGDKLVFRVLEVCPASDLVEREQHHLGARRATLNIARVVNNVWTDPGVRARLRAVHLSSEWRAARAAIARATARRVAVITDDGQRFGSMAEAARRFGVGIPTIAHLVRSQQRGKIGVRMKRDDGVEWAPETTLAERYMAARLKNGTLGHSEATKAKLKAANAGRRPTAHATEKGAAASRIAVIGTPTSGGDAVRFSSGLEAGRTLRPDRPRTACAQISKAISGVKPTAYGFTWSRAA